MAAYEYDEGGVMATYFFLTILALVLIPLTLTSVGKGGVTIKQGCECDACVQHRAEIKERERSISPLTWSKKTYFLIGGWTVFGLLSWKAVGLKSVNKIYDPFEILGITSTTPEKDIKSHFKKLSRQFHPDKVKATAENTLEEIQTKFVEITKAYKSLTDPKIRDNWLKYNHPDGPQSTSMGIALPPWIVEAQNNKWVLGFYGLLFGGALPAAVGRWWFGNRQKTKDGVMAQSAASFFKSLKEESTLEEVVGTLCKAYLYELPAALNQQDQQVQEIEQEILKHNPVRYLEVKKAVAEVDGGLEPARARALTLMYAHLLRLDVKYPRLREEQRKILLATPALLSALLNVSTSRNWLAPTLGAMRLHAHLAQALTTEPFPRKELTQLPGVSREDVNAIEPKPRDVTDVLAAFEEKKDDSGGRVDIVDASFKVIGERVISPSSIIYLLVKLRIVPPGSEAPQPKDLSIEETKKKVKRDEEKDEAFMLSKTDSEELDAHRNDKSIGWAHAPLWPANRKPTWWIVLGDEKGNRIVVPPIRIADVPFSDPEADRDYRSYKIQFQGPPSTGLFTWKLYVVSDTWVSEDVVRDIQLKIEDPIQDDEPSEDDISEPDEDTLAGQMAAMRGEKVKKRGEDDSDEESGTDDDEEEDDSSDSDSD
ncbi:translocation protein sec63 [Coprinopsis sp. MPI-PUGE-AT-0042]|nr:translocation protein sec63 [Coprinopsis sp. MPI-PUGE-AT-0042]